MNDLFQAGHNAALYMQNYIFTAYNQNKKITFADAWNVCGKNKKQERFINENILLSHAEHTVHSF